MSQVYLNGDFFPLEEAKVSVLDRGFLFGDGVYEVIPAFNGRLVEMQAHLDRLEDGLKAVGIEAPEPEGGWEALCRKLLESNRSLGEHRAVYLQITRGAGKTRSHIPPANLTPTVFVMVMATGAPMTGQAQDMKGATAITMKDRRWKRCSIKSVSLLGNLMGFDHARAGGAHDAIQINEDGYVTEACAANIFVVREGRIMTPPLSENILPGVTRALVLSVAQEDSRYACEETAVTLSDLQQAEEIWLTSSTKEIRPIVSLDGVTVGSGEPGPVWRHIAPLFCARRDAVSS